MFPVLQVWSFCERLPNNASRQRGCTTSTNVKYGEEQTLLHMPLIDTNQVRQSANAIEAREHLNL